MSEKKRKNNGPSPELKTLGLISQEAESAAHAIAERVELVIGPQTDDNFFQLRDKLSELISEHYGARILAAYHDHSVKVNKPVTAVVHVKTESCDDYYVKLREPWPKTETEQLECLRRNLEIDEEAWSGGPGLAGSWLHVEAVTEV